MILSQCYALLFLAHRTGRYTKVRRKMRPLLLGMVRDLITRIILDNYRFNQKLEQLPDSQERLSGNIVRGCGQLREKLMGVAIFWKD